MKENPEFKVQEWQLRQRQALPLDAKIELTKRRITEWVEHYEEQVYVAFSGGLDSLVLLHMARQVYPNCPGVFHDTGLEFPEIRDFVKTIENVEWTKPKRTFKRVIEEEGYPVVSKRISQYVKEVQRAKEGSNTVNLRTKGLRRNGTYSKMAKISDKWLFLIDAPFKISDKCCYYFKKKPSEDYEKRTGRHGMIGTRTEESAQREITHLMHGCNGFQLTKPRSTPIAFWLDEDIREYIKINNIEYSKIYDMGYTRTGCMFCMLGCHMESKKGLNRFQIMQKTHPKLYKYCMEKLGIKKVMEYVGIPYSNEQLALFND